MPSWGLPTLYVAFNFSTDAWVNFKLFGGMGLLLAFAVGQACFCHATSNPAQETKVDAVRDHGRGRARQPAYGAPTREPAHMKRIQALADDGRIILAGPFPAIDSPDPGPAGVNGSLIVAEFRCLDDARAWIDADPYVKAGVYAQVEVKPFTRMLP